MSRYDELCVLCEAALKRHEESRDRVLDFLGSRFLPGLVRFLECPDEHVWIFDYNGSRYEDVTLRTVLQSDDERWWNIGLVVRIDGNSRFLDFEYLLRCRASESHFVVELAGREFVIADDASLDICFTHITAHVRGQMARGLTDQSRRGAPWRIEFSPCDPGPARFYGQLWYDVGQSG
jgi:hypothetical protein